MEDNDESLIVKKIVTWIRDDTLKVIELKLGTPDSEIASGIYYLGKIMKL